MSKTPTSDSKMKNSGLPWIEPIPQGWKTLRFKQLLKERNDRSKNGSEQLLRVSQYTGITERHADAESGAPDTRAKSLLGYKLVGSGDLVVNIMLAWNGSLGVSPFNGIVSPAYCVFKIREKFEPKYLHYLLRTPQYKSVFKMVSTGIVESRLRLYPEQLLQLHGLVPPLPEQTAIVRYLDQMDKRIRKAIAAKQKLIKLLEEQKQAIIHQAVTRGLNPHVRLKPSGVEWLGEVPETWEIRKIATFAKVGNGSTPSRGNPAYWRGGNYPWLNSGAVKNGNVTESTQFVTEQALKECHLPKVPPGSVLVAITGQGKTRGTSALLHVEATINQHIAYISTGPGIQRVVPEFLQLTLSEAYQELRRISDDSGSTKGALTCEALKHFKIPVPPVQEQEQVIREISSKTAGLNKTLKRIAGEVQLLQEYHTRLIADVVTGKLDIREAVANLPDEDTQPKSEETELQDDSDSDELEDEEMAEEEA